MNENDFADFLSEMIVEEVDNIRTFEEAAIMTDNTGLVIKLADGSEFQVTIVRSN